MQKLNLPEYSFNYKEIGANTLIFDNIRRKYVALTPEEWVRQNFAQYLISAKNYPKGLIAIEYNLNLNETIKRCDIVAFNKNAEPLLIVECKSTKIKITQKVFEQIARYNMVLKVDYLVVTNGLDHYCCKIDFQTSSYAFIKEIPEYNSIAKE